MQHSSTTSESIRFGENDYLAGVLSYSAEANPRLAIIICSPHPNFGGDMANNVIAALTERLSIDAVTLSFDYRGIGASRVDLPQGLSVFDYWETIEQSLEYAAPYADTTSAIDEVARLTGGLPIITVGYSFGAIMGTYVGVHDPRVIAMVGVSPPLKRVKFEHLENSPKPCLLLSGQDDFVFDPDVANVLIKGTGPNLIFQRPRGDHFFIGLESGVANLIAEFVEQQISPNIVE